ncbi:MAG: hypothetical protein IJP37_01995 [Clostridia bacterium]|nr:hypothetical protein [Clostridia bacterium]
MKKRTFSTELAYVLGIVLVALGAAFCTKGDLGLSTVIAPAYVLYLKLSEIFPFVTFGMMEYVLQAVLLLGMIIVLRKFRLSYLFSFITAVIYGFTLDGCMLLVGLIPGMSMAWRIGYYVIGMLLCALGIAFMFRTYISPEVYELLVKEVSVTKNFNITKVKITYDCISCAVAIILSFCFFGLWHFEGVKLGTVLCALFNGKIIDLFSKWLGKRYEFRDALPIRKYFE